jgi:hypothetical protein
MTDYKTMLLEQISKNIKEILFYIFWIWFLSLNFGPIIFFFDSETKVSSDGVVYQVAEIEGERFIIQNLTGLRQIVGKLEAK